MHREENQHVDLTEYEESLRQILALFEDVEMGTAQDYFAGGIKVALEILTGELDIDDLIEARLREIEDEYSPIVRDSYEWVDSSVDPSVDLSDGEESETLKPVTVRRKNHLRLVK